MTSAVWLCNWKLLVDLVLVNHISGLQDSSTSKWVSSGPHSHASCRIFRAFTASGHLTYTGIVLKTRPSVIQLMHVVHLLLANSVLLFDLLVLSFFHFYKWVRWMRPWVVFGPHFAKTNRLNARVSLGFTTSSATPIPHLQGRMSSSASLRHDWNLAVDRVVRLRCSWRNL